MGELLETFQRADKLILMMHHDDVSIVMDFSLGFMAFYCEFLGNGNSITLLVSYYNVNCFNYRYLHR